MNDNRFEHLLGLFIDDVISDEQLQELSALVSENPEHADQLRLQLSMADRLSRYKDDLRGDADSPDSAETKRAKSVGDDDFVARVVKSAQASKPDQGCSLVRASRRRFAVWVLAFSAVAVSALILSVVLNPSPLAKRPASEAPLDRTNQSEPVDRGMAVVTQETAAQWSSGRKLHVGDTIAPGILTLESGLAQIEFYSGASVILQGPAELELINLNRAVCGYGKIRARVPFHARGFTLVLPTVELVDLGTEFGVQVTQDGETEVHVFDGTVELYQANSNRDQQTRREIVAGDGLHINAAGEFSDMKPNYDHFVAEPELEELGKQEAQRRLDLWREQSLRLGQDPRLLVHYAFEHDDSQDRILFGFQQDQESFSGSIVGCAWTSGRWPGKYALDFKRPGDRVRIHIPGEFNSLTLMAWIRVDGLDRAFSSLLLTDQYEVGEAHWQIDRIGRLVLGIHHADGESKNYLTPRVFNLMRLGQWTQVATVFDGPTGQVRHYINGALSSETPIHFPTTLNIGSAEIGNWGQPIVPYNKPIRNFNGRIDELAIFRTALTNEDIRALYEVGRP